MLLQSLLFTTQFYVNAYAPEQPDACAYRVDCRHMTEHTRKHNPEAQHEREARQRPAPQQRMTRVYQRLIRKLELSEAHRTSFDAAFETYHTQITEWLNTNNGLIQTYRQEFTEWHRVNKETFINLRRQLRDAKTSNDQDAIECVLLELHTLLATAPKPSKELQAAIESLPSAEDIFSEAGESISEAQKNAYNHLVRQLDMLSNGIRNIGQEPRPPTRNSHENNAE